jgi:hypothetical protein
MTQVTIGTTTYDVYRDLAETDAYLAGSVNQPAWAALSDDEKTRAIVAATRLLDRQRWLGEKTVADQPLAWPRTGIDGVDDATIPAQVLDAHSELTLALATGSSAETSVSTAFDGTRRLKAGSAEVEYFFNASQQLAGTRFPLAVQELIGQWLVGTGTGGAVAFGTGNRSRFRLDDCLGPYDPRTWP